MTRGKTSENQWAWLEIYPQHGFTKNEDGELMKWFPLCKLFRRASADKIAMNDKNVMGRSYTSRYGQDRIGWRL